MRVLCTGAGGFIGGHLVKALLDRGDEVRAVDVKPLAGWQQVHEGAENRGDWDLRSAALTASAPRDCDLVFALAADMGGMGYLSTRPTRRHGTRLISVNTIQAAVRGVRAVLLYVSSACIYPEYRQDTDVAAAVEDMALPAAPRTGYGWEKLVTERLLRVLTRRTRPGDRGSRGSTTSTGRSAPTTAAGRRPRRRCAARSRSPLTAARSRCGATASRPGPSATSTTAWKASAELMQSDLLRSAEHRLGPAGDDRPAGADGVMASGKKLGIRHVDGPQGVRGRNSDNTLCRKVLGWEPRSRSRTA